MPNRIIKESIRTSYEINELSPEAEVSFYRLLTFADDFGRFPSDIRILQAQLFPLRASIRSKDFDTWISELVKAGLIELYIGDDGKPYGYFVTWEDHQTIRNKKSKYPEPDGGRYESLELQLKEIERIRNQLKSIEINCPRESNPIQSESESNPNPSDPPDEPDGPTFDEFWDSYDKKVDKKKSRQKWKRLSKADREAIMQFIPIYKTYQPDPQYRKNPTTFFNNRSWEDEFIASEVEQGRTASDESNHGTTNTTKRNDPGEVSTPGTVYEDDILSR